MLSGTVPGQAHGLVAASMLLGADSGSERMSDMYWLSDQMDWHRVEEAIPLKRNRREARAHDRAVFE